MEFRLLGPMEVLDRGTPLALGGLKQRALLARLLVTANRTVSVDRLVDDLWGDAVPGTAVKMVQIYVSQLRKILPADVLVTRPPGYLVEVDPEAIDVGRFDRLRRTGRAALEAGEPGTAAARLSEALGLWRGEALAEFGEPFAQVERNHLHELRLACLEDRIEAELMQGRHAELVGELAAEVRGCRCASGCTGSGCSRSTGPAGTPTRSRSTRTSGADSTTSSASSRLCSSVSCRA